MNLNLAWTLTPAATFNYSEFPQTLFDDYEKDVYKRQFWWWAEEACKRKPIWT